MQHKPISMSAQDMDPSDEGVEAPAAGPPTKKARKQLQRAKHWVWTVFSAELVSAPQALIERLTPQVTYAICQRELAPGTGRRHLQGYSAHSRPVSIKQVKEMLGDGAAHLEVARGTPEEASDYCKKEASRDTAADSGPFTCGVLANVSGQGRRMDLEKLKVDLDKGTELKDIAGAHFSAFLRYARSIKEYRQLTFNVMPRSFQTECIVYWGPPGSGKTRSAGWFDTPEHTFWLPRPRSGSAWWDGYQGQRTVVVDEFYGWLQRDLVQRLIDRTPLRVEIKGDTVNFRARRVIFTSNTDPPRWWPRVGLGAMERRLAEPIGAVVYLGTAEYPDAESYLATLPEREGAGRSTEGVGRFDGPPLGAQQLENG